MHALHSKANLTSQRATVVSSLQVANVLQSRNLIEILIIQGTTKYTIVYQLEDTKYDRFQVTGCSDLIQLTQSV